MGTRDKALPDRAVRAQKIGISIHHTWLESLRGLQRSGEVASVSAGIATALRQCKKAKLPPFDGEGEAS